MNERRIHIYSEKQCDQTFLIHGYLETQVDDTVINEIINNPISEVIQISDYISESTLRKLNEVFIKRPDIQFRVVVWCCLLFILRRISIARVFKQDSKNKLCGLELGNEHS